MNSKLFHYWFYLLIIFLGYYLLSLIFHTTTKVSPQLMTVWVGSAIVFVFSNDY